ncbi:putative deoxyribonuclease [Wickerhamomyces ciferrii]|uniref:Deoxyribonuclease n=1 Tax=Wickerhamomyces ciferrii (strain ATCC 14091 / BCRC 22168 / CBS 111 / JCM 3599 / NBRC 0793 / NRRL Y-1031 F-60-10) TaxID=1206466 RepID=K0KIM0_WICCF|nr:putative deoxyribonuclease [Wickerhamomyces ciferrii]CCH42027.1 putative deoxyribonuclease [Wickerhamomyces ciferrii]
MSTDRKQSIPFNKSIKYFDIGVNFTDPMFHGEYNGKPAHPSDIEDVILRAKTFNVRGMLLTGSSLEESRTTLNIANSYPNYLYSTVGVHPCSVNEINSENESQYLDNLKELAISGKKSGIVKAFGEIGLDYDRLHYTPKDHQCKYFQKQLDIAIEVGLPLFLHMRAANDDFIQIIKPYLSKIPNGVVHSFTGTEDELKKLLDLGFYIGVNGCSLKTEENLKVVSQIPLDRLMIETDAPWCEIRKTHAGYKYLTSYPNETYPLVITPQSEISTPSTPSSGTSTPSKKQQPIKLDPILPFPLLKKEHYERFNINERTLIGEKSAPLIKSRNEPVHIGQVVEIIANLQNESVENVVKSAWKNSLDLFKIDDVDEEFFTY